MRSARGSTLVQPAYGHLRLFSAARCEVLWYPLTGIRRCSLTAYEEQIHKVQRHSYKAVISRPWQKKLAAITSLSGQPVKEILSLIKAMYEVMPLIVHNCDRKVNMAEKMDSSMLNMKSILFYPVSPHNCSNTLGRNSSFSRGSAFKKWDN